MREVGFLIAGVAVAFVWAAVWFGLLHTLGIAPFWRISEDSESRRERLNRLGKWTYILTYGVFGSGLSFGLAMITVDFVGHRSRGWSFELVKLLIFALGYGLVQGLSGWRRAFRDPVPFPPNYPPVK